MSEQNPLTAVANAGVSIWLDDLSRDRIKSGGLRDLITNRNVVGVTTNPTIFAGALAQGEQYAEQVAELASAGADATEAVFDITTDDVAAACDVFAGVYEASDGQDGRVSIEVEPSLAHDAAGTVAQAKALWQKVNRPNAMIKIPATEAGLTAIAEVIANGISVNVTLIFSLTRYREVINAYLSGLEKARQAGLDISTIHSVASFFVSRVDTEIDKRLTAIGSPEAAELKGKAGLANARLAYQVYEQSRESERWRLLADAGAHAQRPLWASTGVKDPSMPDTTYVDQLVAANTVNTMPEKTLEAVYDHGVFEGDTVTGQYEHAGKVLDAVEHLGVSYLEVTGLLEAEGVEKFVVSWNELLETVTAALEEAR